MIANKLRQKPIARLRISGDVRQLRKRLQELKCANDRVVGAFCRETRLPQIVFAYALQNPPTLHGLRIEDHAESRHDRKERYQRQSRAEVGCRKWIHP